MAKDEVTTSPSRTAISAASLRAKRKDPKEACIVEIYGEDLGRRVALGQRPVVIGRSSACDVQVDQESVSRNHCQISFNGNTYCIRDMGSTNGTYVNDDLVEEVSLVDGDQVKVGRTILKFLVGSNIETQYHEEIYQLMTVDGLTQVYNKRHFDEVLEREVSRAERYDRCFSLVLFDIDHFKNVNDTHGHLAGDAVLRQLGQIVRHRVRRDDTVARVGGEEFAIILPEIDCTVARDVAEKLRKVVEASSFRFEAVDLNVTVSLGVGQWRNELRHSKALIKSVDDCLYQAKSQGRNRVVGCEQ